MPAVIIIILCRGGFETRPYPLQKKSPPDRSGLAGSLYRASGVATQPTSKARPEVRRGRERRGARATKSNMRNIVKGNRDRVKKMAEIGRALGVIRLQGWRSAGGCRRGR